MTSLSTQLAHLHHLRQQQHQQVMDSLQQLSSQIEQQMATLHQQEQPLLVAQSELLALLQPQLQSDARCLLPLDEFRTAILPLIGGRLYGCGGLESFSVAPDPTDWLLHSLNIPVQIQHYEPYRDDWAYNDEQHYTEYRYRFTAVIDTWKREISSAVVSLYPRNPIECRREGFRVQHQHIVSHLFANVYPYRGEPAAPKFAFLSLDTAGQQQLKQELSALLVYVGALLFSHSLVDYFRYPIHYSEDA